MEARKGPAAEPWQTVGRALTWSHGSAPRSLLLLGWLSAQEIRQKWAEGRASGERLLPVGWDTGPALPYSLSPPFLLGVSVQAAAAALQPAGLETEADLQRMMKEPSSLMALPRD